MPLEGPHSLASVDRHELPHVATKDVKASSPPVQAAAAGAPPPSSTLLSLPLDRRSGTTTTSGGLITAGCFLRATAAAAAAAAAAAPVAGVAPLPLGECPNGGGTEATATDAVFKECPALPVASRKRPRPSGGRPAPVRHKTNGQQQQQQQQQAAGHKTNAIMNQLEQDNLLANLRGENQQLAQSNDDTASLRGEVNNDLKLTHGGSIFSAASLSGLIYQGYIHPPKRENGEHDAAAGRHISYYPSRGRLEHVGSSAIMHTENTTELMVTEEEQSSPGTFKTPHRAKDVGGRDPTLLFPSGRISFPAHRPSPFLSDTRTAATIPSTSSNLCDAPTTAKDAAAWTAASHTARKGLVRPRQGGNTANVNVKQLRPAKAVFSERLEDIMAAYASDDNHHHYRASSKECTRGRKKQAGSSAAAGAGAGAGAGPGAGMSAAAVAVSSVPVPAAVTDAQRARQLEAMMHAAMENPVTYEEQIRRERLAHLRMMCTVEKEMAELPVEFLRGIGYEEYGINLRISRMCAVLGKSHRWTRARALSRWARALERAQAEKFARDMQAYEYARLFEALSSARQRWELKHVRSRFLGWRRRVRLWRAAEDQRRYKKAASKVQRWARRRLGVRRRRRAWEQRERRRAEEASEMADAIAGVLGFEDSRRQVLRRTLRLLEEKKRYETYHQAATELQHAWLRHVARCRILEAAEKERQELDRRRVAEQAKRWAVLLPMAEAFLSACLTRSSRAALAKIRARGEHLRLVYEAELADHLRFLGETQAVIARIWKGKIVRLEFLARREALVDVQRAWKRAVVRRGLQREIDARVLETAARIAKARTAAAVLLQSFALRRAERHRLAVRFAARRARLDFERRNRAELASACLVLYAPSFTIRDCAGPEDFESMADAVKPALAVARMRASAASRGVSLEDMSRSARASGSVGEGHDAEGQEEGGGGGGDSGGGGDGGSTVVGPAEGALLALAVLQQEDTQRRAAIRVQRAVRRKKAQHLLDERFRLQKVKLEKARRDRGARRVQRAWSASKLRREVTKRVERTARRVEAERDAASRRLQKLCRRRQDAKELASRFAIRKIILEQARSLREMVAAAAIIQQWYRRRNQMYYATVRVVARYQLALKRTIAAEEAYKRRREGAAAVLQLAWRNRLMRVYLSGRFKARKARISSAREAAARERGASVLQGWWRRLQARRMLNGRFAKRARLMAMQAKEKERERAEDRAARVLQRVWRRHDEWKKMRLRFRLRRKVLNETFALEESKRLELEFQEKERREAEKQMHRDHEATKVKLLLEEAEKKRKSDEAASHLLNAWKLGYDLEKGSNYWFNHVTGESSATRPEGWTIKPSERWHKQMNDKGLAYYLDLETGKSHWFPPCEKCYKREGEKVCHDCEDQVYCGRCWTVEHKPEDMAGHSWKGADSGKEDLAPGERHCVDCGFRKAKWVCLQCKDAMCGECNARIHGSGNRKNHQVESYAKFKKGWQTVGGRTDNEPTFYFNATTNESTFDKPQELMLPEELAEHKRFLEYKETSEKYVKKIEKLQFQLEELMYEKDKIAYQWANAQKDMKTKGGGDTLPTMGGLSFGTTIFGGGKGKPKKPKGAGDSATTPGQEEAYRKSLLISRKDKKDMGFEVKLKKQAVLDA